MRGQLDGHRRAHPDLALDRDRAFLLVHELPHAGQAQSAAAVVLGHPPPEELVEDRADVARVDAPSFVGDDHAHVPARARLNSMSTGESGGEYFRALTTRLVTTRCMATPLAVASAKLSATWTRAGS